MSDPIRVRCPECNGSGEIQDGGEFDLCPVCDGVGTIEEDDDTCEEE